MIRTCKIRLLPTQEQEEMLWQAVGANRFVWNWGLSLQMERFEKGEKFLSLNELKKQLVQLKQGGDYSWLKDVSSQTVATTLIDLDIAYKRFFKLQKQGEKFTAKTIAKAKRLKRKLTPYDMQGHPKFKKRGFSKPSFYSRSDSLYFKNGTVNLEKIGKVEYQTNYDLPNGRGVEVFSNPRVAFSNGKWLLTFGREIPIVVTPLNPVSAGIDLGIKNLAVVSCDEKVMVFKNINKAKAVKRLKKQLKHSQRMAARRQERSKNQQKAYKRVNKLYSKISNIRHNHTHQVTTEIVNLLPSKIVLEDLNVRGMMKNRHLSRAIQEQGFHKFRFFMEYKAQERGIELIVADRFYPSSKKCSCCGAIKQDLKLKDRVYRCGVCGLEIDRDTNAARNLEKLAV